MLNDLFDGHVPRTLAAVVGIGLGVTVGTVGIHNGPVTTPEARCGSVLVVTPQHDSGLWARPDCP